MSFAIFAKIAKLSDQKKFWIKQLLLKSMDHGSNFFILYFLENDNFSLKSVES